MIAPKSFCALAAAVLCAVSATGASAALVNASFEVGPSEGAPIGWTDTDSVVGSSRCDASCSPTAGAPSNGSYWIWFGGSSAAQTAVLSQNTLIESTAGFLLFDFWTALTKSDASLVLSIDSTDLWTVTQATASTYAAGYSTVSIPLGASADGGTHLIRWNFTDAAVPVGSGANWHLDNLRLAARATELPEPGSLTLVGTAVLGLAALRRRKT